MRGSRSTTWTALGVTVAVSMIAAGAAAMRDEAMIKCVEGGGIYYDDGRCEGGTNADPAREPEAEAAPDGDDGGEATVVEVPEDAEAEARKACRKEGGRYKRDGTCEIRRDPIERCKDVGGIFMVDGKCYRPEY